MELSLRATLLSLVAISLMCSCFAAAKDVECEVCTAVLQRLYDSVPNDDRTNAAKIEAKLKKDCKEIHQPQEHRFCYYVGGLEESATSTINELAKPLSWGMPVDKVCERLRKKDTQICDLKYEKELDWSTLDINKLKVKDLKKILGDWGEDCKGCAEKSDFVKKVQEVKSKYVKEEL
ncbi:putative Mesencephalic astrocyte-derived neurotrophic factor-like protein [Hypsibius exemplaris]|uniref:Mesencephalic astrocyte-derived neurotrophic factor homolog n=1 Tax=Hypsibius exemplaris TaxID=2072580 RepID=A0A1W0X9U6_HYPEX|nr:putative Mesencephalic astrocyte-derived neurotrophic factor-like protein [Hypsibius exemplaris]